MKRFMCLFSVFFVLTSLMSLPAVGQKWEPKKGVFVLYEEQLRDMVAFRQALEDGNVAIVKNIVDSYPHKHLLNSKIDYHGALVFPICIAAEKGNDQLVSYMADKIPTLVNEKCEHGVSPFAIALFNQHAKTALTLVKLGAETEIRMGKNEDHLIPVFQAIALKFTDKNSLEALIPVLLDAGVNYSETESHPGHLYLEADGFFTAAEKGNKEFIRVLRDELLKRGQLPISHCRYVNSPGAWEKVQKMETLLKDFGVRLEGHTKQFYPVEYD